MRCLPLRVQRVPWRASSSRICDDDRTAARVVCGQIVHVPVEVTTHLVFGRRDETEADPVAHQSGGGAQRERHAVPQRIQHARATVEFSAAARRTTRGDLLLRAPPPTTRRARAHRARPALGLRTAPAHRLRRHDSRASVRPRARAASSSSGATRNRRPPANCVPARADPTSVFKTRSAAITAKSSNDGAAISRAPSIGVRRADAGAGDTRFDRRRRCS